MSKNTKKRLLLTFSIVLFLVSVFFLIHYLVIQPHHSREVQKKYKDIYYSDSESFQGDPNESYYNELPSNSDYANDFSKDSLSDNESSFDVYINTKYKPGAKDKNGILKKFKRLLEFNPDVKGWLHISNTCIDYPVMQSNDIDYYLYRDFEKNKDKNGSLYIDEHCSIQPECKNIVIHGHNMFSTNMMFYELPNYKNIDYYRQHPVITFDTLYEESQWKIISYITVYGNPNTTDGFNYMKGHFDSSTDFNEFLYQIELRSPYYCPVTVNEDDTLLMLSTCTGELNNGRGVVVARRVRQNEAIDVNVSLAYEKSEVLYPSAWYSQYGGTPPKVTDFSTAQLFKETPWYDGAIEPTDYKDITFEDKAFVYRLTSPTTADIIKCKATKSTELKIPDTTTYLNHDIKITYILANCFDNMNKLEKIKYNNYITKIPDKAFINCPKIKYITIGKAVESIGYKAFFNLDSLKKVTINSEVLSEVKQKAFWKKECVFKIDEKYIKKYRQLIINSQIKESCKFVKK